MCVCVKTCFYLDLSTCTYLITMFLPLGSEQSHKKAQLSRFKGGWHFKSSKRRFIVPSKKRLAASGDFPTSQNVP